MDPDLIALAMRLLQGRRAARQDIAASNGTPIAPADAVSSAAGMAHSINDSPFSDEQEDARMRELSGGKYGRADVMNYLNGPHGPTGDVTPGNVGRAALQGPLFNYADELLGMARGDGAKQDFRLRQEMFAEKNPLLANLIPMATGTAAALAVPESMAAKGFGLLGITSPVVRAVVTGGAMSGLASSGAADDAGLLGRAKAGAVGAAIGAPIGAAMPFVAKSVTNAVSPNARMLNRLGSIFDKSGLGDVADINLTTGQPISKAQTILEGFKRRGLGDVVTVADLNQQMRDEAERVSTLSPNANAAIKAVGEPRRMANGARVLSTVTDALGNSPSDAEARLAELQSSQSSWAKGAYDKLRQDDVANTLFPGSTPATPEYLAAQADLANGQRMGIGGVALQSLKNRVAKLAPPVSPQAGVLGSVLEQPKVTDALARAQAAGLIGKTPEPVMQPTFSKVFQIKNDLQDAADKAINAGGGKSQLGFNLKEAADIVDQHLVDNVPDYAATQAEYARREGLKRAVKAGQAAYNSEDTRGLGAQFAGLSPDEQGEFRTGMASELVSELRATKSNTDAAAKLVSPNGQPMSPALGDKLGIVFGDQPTFDDTMDKLQGMRQLRQIEGAYDNSKTARRGAMKDGLVHNLGPLGLVAAGLHEGGLKGAAIAGASLPLQAYMKSVGSRTLDEIGNALSTQGTKPIQDFIDELAQRNAATKVGMTALPALTSRLPGLLQQP